MEIISPVNAGPELTKGINQLLDQLTGMPGQLSRHQLKRLLASETSRLMVAVEKGVVLGMLTLVIYPIPSATRAVVEDMVVDRSARRKGVGRALLADAIRRARAMGAESLNLTSNPSRKAANRLYRRMGFVPRDTNAYRLTFEPREKTR